MDYTVNIKKVIVPALSWQWGLPEKLKIHKLWLRWGIVQSLKISMEELSEIYTYHNVILFIKEGKSFTTKKH